MSAREALYAALCARGTEHVAAVDLINNHDAEELNKAADTIATDRDTTNPSAGKGAYRRGMNRAEDIVRRLAAVAGEKNSPAGADTTPDFFQPGHVYTRQHHARTVEFHVRYIDISPDGGYPEAFGWRKDPEIDVWLPATSDDMDGWIDITGSGEPA